MSAKKSSTLEKKVSRKRDENYTIVSLLVPRQWSNQLSDYVREKGWTKTSFIQKVVDQYFKSEEKVDYKKELEEVNRKLDTVLTVLMELVKKN